jgi:MFS family permease
LLAITTLHATTFQVAAIAAADGIGWPIVGLPAGVYVDRFSRRRILVGTDVGRALVLASIPVAAALGVLSLPQIYVVGVLAGVLSVVFAVAYPAYLPSLVPASDLVAGNALLSGAESVAQVAGPSLGGVLVQLLRAPYAIAADAASFVISAASLLRIRAPEPARVARHRSMRHEIAEGVRFLFGHRVLRAFMLTAAISNMFATGIRAISVLFLVRDVHLRAAAIGGVFAAASLGGVVGAVGAGPLARRFGEARVMTGAAVVEAASAFLFPLTGPGWRIVLFSVGGLTTGLAIIAFNVVGSSYRQEVVPPDLVGRVVAATRVFSWGVLPIGSLGAGWLGASFGIRTALWWLAAGLVLAPVSLVVARVGGERDLPRPPVLEPLATPPFRSVR